MRTFNMFNMMVDEVGALIKRYIANEGVTYVEDEPDELNGSSEGLKGSGSKGSTKMPRHWMECSAISTAK